MYNNENNQGFGPYDSGNAGGNPYGGPNGTGQPGSNPSWANDAVQTGQPWANGAEQTRQPWANQYGQPEMNPGGQPWTNPDVQTGAGTDVPPYYNPQASGPYYNGQSTTGTNGYGFPPPYQGAGQPNMPYVQASGEVYDSRKNSGLAIACLVLGILGFLSGVFFVGIALDVLAVILGIVALIQNNKKKGLPIAGMVLAVLSILLTFLFYYVVAMDKDASVRGIKDAARYLPTAEEKAASSVLMENIVLEDYATSRNLILIYENKNARDVQLEITVTYYNENDDLLFLRNNYVWSCAAGGKAAVDVTLPYDKDYNDIPYSRYEVDTIARETDPQYYTPNYGKDFQIKSNQGIQGGVIASVTNPTGKTFDSVELMCVYFKDGAAVGSAYEYISDMGKAATVEFSAPYDINYNDLSYDDYEIFVNSTTIYSN